MMEKWQMAFCAISNLKYIFLKTVYNVVPLTLVKDLLPIKQGLVRENSQPQCVPDIFTVKNEIK